MFSQLVSSFGYPIENGLGLYQSQPSCKAFTTTDRVARSHLSAANRRPSSTNTSRSFSPLRLFFGAALLWGARGQPVEPFPANIELSSINGTIGFVLNGEAVNDHSGVLASSAGDVNGDGINDLIIGADGSAPGGKNSAGKSYVIFGKKGLGALGSIDLFSLTGANGFVLNGEAAGDYSGNSVSIIGDVNGDGIDDLIIGAYLADPGGKSGAGKSYVIFGKKGLGASGSIELSSLTGVNGFVLNGEASDDWSGYSVSSAGDVNGDGIGDFLIGANKADPSGKSSAGKSYVIFGQKGLGASGSIELSSLSGTKGFMLNGEAVGDGSGNSVSSAGDVNGDGIGDLITGANFADSSGKFRAGKSYVIFGKKGLGVLGSIELSSLTGTNGFVLNGEATDDRSGRPVSSTGDVNGDGFDDILIGAKNASPNGNSNAGKSYVIFGRKLTNNQQSTSPVIATPSATLPTTRYVTIASSTPSATIPTTRSVKIESSTPSTLTSSTPQPKRSSASMMSHLQSRKADSTDISSTGLQSTLSDRRSTTNSAQPLSSSKPFSSPMMIPDLSTSNTTPLIVGLAVAVGAPVSSLFAGIAVFINKGSKHSSSSLGTALQASSQSPSTPSEYVSIDAIAPNMQSARVENIYDQISQKPSTNHYKGLPKEQPISTKADYDNINLDQENRAMEQYQAAKRHENYDDLDVVV